MNLKITQQQEESRNTHLGFKLSVNLAVIRHCFGDLDAIYLSLSKKWCCNSLKWFTKTPDVAVFNNAQFIICLSSANGRHSSTKTSQPTEIADVALRKPTTNKQASLQPKFQTVWGVKTLWNKMQKHHVPPKITDKTSVKWCKDALVEVCSGLGRKRERSWHFHITWLPPILLS